MIFRSENLLPAFLVLAISAEGMGIALGAYRSCMVLMYGRVNCWGANTDGELGDGTTTDRSNPVDMPSITTATSVALGESHSSVMLTNDKVMCWDGSSSGDLLGWKF